MANWYSPQPKRKPKKLPRRRPIKAVPSGIGDQGIVGNWLFYYLRGGDHLHDFSPEKNHGTISGAKFIDGRYGWGLSFDGADDYAEIGDVVIDGLTSFTVSAWINPDVITSDAAGHGATGNAIVDKSGASDDNLAFYLADNDELYLYIDTGTDYSVETSTSPISTGTWTYVVGVYDGSDLILYVNGEQKTSASASGTIIDNTNNLNIGNEDQGDCPFDGIIGVVRIYSVAKSASWIKQRFERTKGIFGL